MDVLPRILVTGQQGTLARALACSATGPGVALVAIGRPQLDVRDPRSIATVIEDIRPDVVVNTAAFTDLDAAEADPEAAHAVNAVAAGALAHAAKEAGAALIHISTDYVFSGAKGAPYTEEDPTDPINVYGRTKAEGEARVLAVHPQATILRAAWVFDARGPNFVTRIIDRILRNEPVSVVSGVAGSPISADGLAAAVLILAPLAMATGLPRIVHISAGDTTRERMARLIGRHAARRTGRKSVLTPVSPAALADRVPRPLDTRLDCRRITAMFPRPLEDWHSALLRVVDQRVAGTDINNSK